MSLGQVDISRFWVNRNLPNILMSFLLQHNADNGNTSPGFQQNQNIRLSESAMDSMTYRLKPVDCCGRERPLRLKSSKLFG